MAAPLPALPPLIDVATLQALLSPLDARDEAHADADLLILDCRFNLTQPDAGEAAWRAAHLPGARYAHLERDLSGPKQGAGTAAFNGRHPLPSLDALTDTLRRWGVHADTRVVALDDAGGVFAARAWWLLRWVGHARVQVLDGGWPAWLAAGGATLTEVDPNDPPARALGTFVPRPQAGWVWGAPDLQAALPELGASRQLIDARAPDRFRGENETLDPVGGHIPGARNRFFQLNLIEGRFKPAALLREEFTALLQGTDPQAAVHQCGSGVTACHNLLAQAHAGLPMGRLYAGSWSEWCADGARPRAVGSAG
ncbi:MAG: sulfurtransferase [Burkholderiales bacterium]|nr:sulfurtransferase [Burkholderiales bacterium]